MQESTRRKHAQALLENPLFQELAAEVDQEIYRQWSQETKKQNREYLWFKATAIREVLGQLKIMAQPEPAQENAA